MIWEVDCSSEFKPHHEDQSESNKNAGPAGVDHRQFVARNNRRHKRRRGRNPDDQPGTQRLGIPGCVPKMVQQRQIADDENCLEGKIRDLMLLRQPPKDENQERRGQTALLERIKCETFLAEQDHRREHQPNDDAIDRVGDVAHQAVLL